MHESHRTVYGVELVCHLCGACTCHTPTVTEAPCLNSPDTWRAELDGMRVQRDQARSIAVRLEQELAEAERKLDDYVHESRAARR